MLSNEEKKAIEYLKIEYEKLMKEDNILFPLYKSDAKRLIDIIEKQSKEIEELKKPKYILNCKTNEITKLTNDFVSKDKIKEIEELKETLKCTQNSWYEDTQKIEEMKKQIDLDNECEIALNNRIMDLENADKKWEDKIKAKIEEVEQWELYNMKIPKLSTLDERLGAKIGIKYILQSLLEKE